MLRPEYSKELGTASPCNRTQHLTTEVYSAVYEAGPHFSNLPKGNTQHFKTDKMLARERSVKHEQPVSYCITYIWAPENKALGSSQRT